MNSRSIALCLIFIVLVFALSGCGGAPRYWYNNQKDTAAAKADLFQCEEEAAAYSRNMGDAGDSKIVEKRLRDCMGLRGYLSLTEDELPRGAPKLR